MRFHNQWSRGFSIDRFFLVSTRKVCWRCPLWPLQGWLFWSWHSFEKIPLYDVFGSELSIFKTSSVVNISFLKWFLLQLFWAVLQGSEAGAFFVSRDVEWSVSVWVSHFCWWYNLFYISVFYLTDQNWYWLHTKPSWINGLSLIYFLQTGKNTTRT